MNIVSLYGSHDSSACIFIDGVYRVFEVEKFVNKRNCSFSKSINFNPSVSPEEYMSYLYFLRDKLKSSVIDVLLQNQIFDLDLEYIRKVFTVNRVEKFDHHLSHAATAVYQSQYKNTLVVTFDGGGEDIDGSTSFFNFYLFNGEFKLIKKIPLDMCGPYSVLAIPLKEINKSTNILPYAGKLMGLSAYGSFNDFIFKQIYDFIKTYNFKKLTFYQTQVEGTLSYDIAYMAQKMFQSIFEETFIPIWKEYSHLPVCFSGGGALNVINNQYISKKIGTDIFIPPNPNDCGLSFGALAYYNKDPNSINIMYGGYDVELDINILGKPVDISEICKDLSNGFIIGILRGRSEIGPRALGNRSIICDPTIKGMKNILNCKVKFREWFRPFAPVICEEDISKYFYHFNPIKFMETSAKMREEYISVFGEVVHVDGTSRVQTLLSSDNPFLYSILKGMTYPILLNTSFNMRGCPLIQKASDAMKMLESTEMDAIIIGDTYIKK